MATLLSDAQTLAQALLDTAYDCNVQYGTYGGCWNECRHCTGKVGWDESVHKIEHEVNCPVLIAKDILTGV